MSPVLTGSIVRETVRSEECYWSHPKSTLLREVPHSWTSSLCSRLFSRPPLLHFTQFWVRPEPRVSENIIILWYISHQPNLTLNNMRVNPSYVNNSYYYIFLLDRMRILFVCFQLCWKFICTTCKDSGLASFPNDNRCIMIYNLNIIEDAKNTTCFLG